MSAFFFDWPGVAAVGVVASTFAQAWLVNRREQRMREETDARLSDLESDVRHHANAIAGLSIKIGKVSGEQV